MTRNRLRNQFTPKEIKLAKAINKMSTWEILQGSEKIAKKIVADLENNLDDEFLCEFDRPELNKVFTKMQKYQVYREYWHQILHQI